MALLALGFAVYGSLALAWAGHALAVAADARALAWMITGALALGAASRLGGARA